MAKDSMEKVVETLQRELLLTIREVGRLRDEISDLYERMVRLEDKLQNDPFYPYDDFEDEVV